MTRSDDEFLGSHPDTPIFNGLVKEFYTEEIQQDFSPEDMRALKTLAYFTGVSVVHLLQDILMDKVTEVLNDARRREEADRGDQSD